MQIIDISVSNFKSFVKLEKVELRKINMVYGLNNSGKSNLLRLIEIIFRGKKNPESVTKAIVDDRVESHTNISEGNFWVGLIENEPFIFHANNLNNPIVFSLTVNLEKNEIENHELGNFLNTKFPPAKADKHEFFFSGDIIAINNYDSKMRLDVVMFNGVKIFNNESYFNSLDPSDPMFENKEAFESIMSLMNNCVKFLDNDRYINHEKENSKLRTLSAKNIKNWLFNLSLDGFDNTKFRNLIKTMTTFKMHGDSLFKENEKSGPFNDFDIEFARIGDEIEIFFKNSFNTYPISSFGTGIQQIFFILLSIFYSQSKIILIEEIELNLSPKYQLELLQFIVTLMDEKSSIHQLIFTTHSPMFCYRGDFSILKVAINNLGATEIKSVDQTELEEFSNMGKLLMRS